MKIKHVIMAALLTWAGAAMAQDFTVGADCGWSTEYESKGWKLFNWQGQERECTALMKEMGMNAMRIRVWVDPSNHGGWCGKDDVLKKALLANQQGMDVMIDFHYSDWWADPAKQNIPKAWEKMSFSKMKQAVADHTVEVLTMLKQNGVSPKWVQVGNETTNGMLWSVEMDPKTGWEKKDEKGNTIITKTMGHIERNRKQYGAFIGAGYDAVKKVFPEAKVIVHLDNGFDNRLYNYNLDIVKEGGGKWDMIGMSLYPYWAIEAGKQTNGIVTIHDCIQNIRKLYRKYGTDVMITETGYEVDESKPWVMEQGRELYAELLRRAKNDTEGHCRGVFYWEPECRPSQYKLGAFTHDGHPTAIMRALKDAGMPVVDYDRKQVKLETTEGDIVVELYNETPIHRDNFLRLANSGALDSTLFHRVIKNFMIQGGAPDSKTVTYTSVDNPTPTGELDVPLSDGQTSIPAEIVYPQFFHKRGALCAAREGDEVNPEFRSSASQFYITWGNWPVRKGKSPYKELLPYYNDYQEAGTPHLDGGYTVFGQVISGMDVVDKIQKTDTDPLDRPVIDVRILRFSEVK